MCQGRNTPDCRAYPEKVRRHVEAEAARAVQEAYESACTAAVGSVARHHTRDAVSKVARHGRGGGERPGLGDSATRRASSRNPTAGKLALGIVTPRVEYDHGRRWCRETKGCGN